MRFEDYKNEFIKRVNKEFGENAQYVLKAMRDEVNVFDRYVEKFVKGRETEKHTREMLDFCLDDYTERARKLHKELLTPVTAKVGDGATICLYSDCHACTIIKVTKNTVTVRRDKATLDPNFKPEFIVGGFAGHYTNQYDQTYTYEADPNGEEITFHWSTKYNRYGTPGNPRLSKGRHEFYDYNF